jgi:hypothetical protein
MRRGLSWITGTAAREDRKIRKMGRNLYIIGIIGILTNNGRQLSIKLTNLMRKLLVNNNNIALQHVGMGFKEHNISQEGAGCAEFEPHLPHLRDQTTMRRLDSMDMEFFSNRGVEPRSRQSCHSYDLLKDVGELSERFPGIGAIEQVYIRVTESSDARAVIDS